MQVIAERLSEEEIAGLKEVFKMIDADNSGSMSSRQGWKNLGLVFQIPKFKPLWKL